MDQYLKHNENFNRLLTEYNKYGSLTIGYDFDGTVYDYHKTGESYEMVRELLRDLKSIGCSLLCWTANEDHVFVKNFCEINNIPVDGINCEGITLGWYSRKPFFSALLDDRAGLVQVYTELTNLVQHIKRQTNK